MNTTEDRSSDARGGSDDMKLEVIVLPVSDVDRAKQFYGRLGWRLHGVPASAAAGAGAGTYR